MVETSYYWEGIVTGDAILAPYSTDRYHTNWQILFTEQDNEGIVDNYLNELVVAGISGGVIVDSGAALVDGSFYENTAQVTVAIPLPITDPRIDRIVLRKDWGNQTIRIFRIAGTENPAPTAPALIQTAGSLWDIPLAQVLITIAGTITVTNEREPAVTPLAPGGGLLHIETIVADGSLTQFNFSNIPQTFKHLMLEFVLRHTFANPPALTGVAALRFNNDAGANYNLQFIDGDPVGAGAGNSVGETFALAAITPISSADAGYASQGTIHIPNYTGDVFKATLIESVTIPENVAVSWLTSLDNSLWRDTDPIEHISLFLSSEPGGAFVAGSTVSLYGIR